MVVTYCFQFRRYRLPLRALVRTAQGAWTEREGVMVRLENECGAVGYGDAAVLPWFGTETVGEAEAACRDLGPKSDDTRLAQVPEKFPCLRNAIVAARSELASAGAGSADRIGAAPLYLANAALLPAGRAALGAVVPKAEIGFRVFKWKVGIGDVADELALLDDVCAALPAGAQLRLDANGAWDRRVAERWLERCADRPVEFVEQPCFAGANQTPTQQEKSEDLLRGLVESYPTPIALDESIAGDRDVERWLEAGWRGIFVVKPSLHGDCAGTLERLGQVKADVVFSSALETAVGARAALRAAFAWPGRGRALGFGVWPLFADARCDGPHAAPFLRYEDIARIDPEAVWNALT